MNSSVHSGLLRKPEQKSEFTEGQGDVVFSAEISKRRWETNIWVKVPCHMQCAFLSVKRGIGGWGRLGLKWILCCGQSYSYDITVFSSLIHWHPRVSKRGAGFGLCLAVGPPSPGASAATRRRQKSTSVCRCVLSCPFDSSRAVEASRSAYRYFVFQMGIRAVRNHPPAQHSGG